MRDPQNTTVHKSFEGPEGDVSTVRLAWPTTPHTSACDGPISGLNT